MDRCCCRSSFLEARAGKLPDNFAVAVIKNGKVVGHVPKTVSRAVYFFLNRDGHSGFCEVTARPTNRVVEIRSTMCIQILWSPVAH